MTSTRPYGGRSLDERRDTRRHQLIEAGLDCLHAEGLSGISVRTVCSEARLTPRYFYENFANLDELLVALVDRCGDAVLTAGLSAFDSDKSIPERSRTGVAAVYSAIAADQRFASVLLASSAHEGMHRRQQQRFLDYTDVLLDLLYQVQGPLDRQRLRPLSLFLVGGTVELISAKVSGLIDVTDDELVERCAEMFVAGWQAAGLTLPT
jgi:AcrR family transcriptional regulator